MEMKRRHKDVAWLLAPPPPQETIIHERAMARETEEMEIVDEEREEQSPLKGNQQNFCIQLHTSNAREISKRARVFIKPYLFQCQTFENNGFLSLLL